ncbi:A24 family peptidase [Clostridium ganghwense]|uniref:A24 family peptidase n=1 Tax=Clostridium ganghwense TaxID=312089 RepID=A0ABT4CQ57_9CLOT|nr:A24 family peptidase [Clostridium ganghwense]MCY6371177.1 A24 family peptidase [Clostridium ganghwense]
MLFDLILVFVLITCFITDLKYQKIYNKVIFPSLIVSLLLHFIFYGYIGLKSSLLGFVVGFGILLIPYFSGGIGAGDVKLLALIGAIKGSTFVFNTALYMAVIGGIMALVVILYHKDSLKFFKELFLWIISLLHGIKYKLELPTSPLLKKYPYGLAIVGGAVICLISKGAWIV